MKISKLYFSILNSQFSIHKGFTLVELMLVMGIFVALIGISTISLANIERNSSLNAEVNKIIPDLKEQQIRAMSGDTGGSGVVSDYGIHFGTTSYTLFRGTYVAGNSSNFEVDLSPNIQVSTTFPGSEMLYQKGSGTVQGPYTITLTDSTNGNTRTLNINRFGAITGVN